MIKILYKNEPYWVNFSWNYDSDSYYYSHWANVYVKRSGFRSIFKKYKKIGKWKAKNNEKISEGQLEDTIERYLFSNSTESPKLVLKCSPEIEALYK